MFDKRLQLGGANKDCLPRHDQSHVYIPDTAYEVFTLFMESAKSFISSIPHQGRVAWAVDVRRSPIKVLCAVHRMVGGNCLIVCPPEEKKTSIHVRSTFLAPLPPCYLATWGLPS
jgi:hypothetical protein